MDKHATDGCSTQSVTEERTVHMIQTLVGRLRETYYVTPYLQYRVTQNTKRQLIPRNHPWPH